MKNDIPFINYYITAWGQFAIPNDLYEKTKWQKFKATHEVGTGKGKMIILGPEAVPENWPFFKWLDEQEKAAGKP